ncbi:helix-turn-helix domain-containing protein [Fibrisoma montanum]|nr:helix-turn-helix domain-containing protein [Fibrisoma montanum]
MNEPTSKVQLLNTVADYTAFFGLPKPAHPLLTLIELVPTVDDGRVLTPPIAERLVPQLYTIFLKRNLTSRVYYGHQPYDFSEGVLGFSAPGEVFRISTNIDPAVSGWVLVFHPDLLTKYPLAKKIKDYTFFYYDVYEALHLSTSEEQMLMPVLTSMRTEYERPIDAFSQDVMVAQLDVLLTYANRFYHRQFLTRRAPENDLHSRFRQVLTAYFADDELTRPMPSVRYFADRLGVSSTYLSDMLRTLTGQGAQQHIQQAMLEKAKRMLLTSPLSIKETAFQLGFEYPHYFNRLFKRKTGLTPAQFRLSMR